MPNRSKGRGQTKSDPTGPPGWGLGRGLMNLSRKKRIITKTKALCATRRGTKRIDDDDDDDETFPWPCTVS